VSGGGRFPSAYEQSVLLGNGIIDNGNIYSTPWPPNVVNTTIATIATMTTIDTFTVTNATGITSGMLFFMPTYGVLTVNNVVGTTITTTTQFQVTPNAVPGTALLFREGSFARITSVFDDNFVFGVGSVQDVYTSAFGSGVPGIEPSGAIPAHIQAAYPNIFGGDAMLAAMGNPGFDLNDYLHYIYVEHNPLTITTTTGYGWFQYS
jgi:hypothetical protein